MNRERCQDSDVGMILAAGAGRRMGSPKPPIVVDGERMVDRAVRVLTDGGCMRVVVITGAWDGPVAGAVTVRNPAWITGIGSSLAAGLRFLLENDTACTRVVIIPVDMPYLTSRSVEAVREGCVDVGAAECNGKFAHPVVLGRSHWSSLLSQLDLRPDQGARNYVRSSSATNYVELQDCAELNDIDMPSQL